MKLLIAAIFVIATMLVFGFVFSLYDLKMYSYFQPKYENARRQAFEQTKSYNSGMIQELQNMQFQYIQADQAHKDALKSLIIHRARDYGEDNLPPDLYEFVHHLESGVTP